MKKTSLKKNVTISNAMSWTDDGKRPKEMSAKSLRKFKEYVEQKKANKKELEALVEETNYSEEFTKVCCKPTAECPNQSKWCCKQCPDRKKLISERMKMLDDDDEDVEEEKKCCTTTSSWICWKTVIATAVILLLLYIIIY